MKYTTLPTKPGRYLDREGDAWTLYADRGWIQVGSITAVGSGCARHYLPFTDAPEDDKPTTAGDKMQRIDNVDDLKPGDLVYFRDDTRGYPFLVREHGHYIRVALCGRGIPLWLCNALSGDVVVDVKYFDHAERPKPSWPEPEGLTPRLYLGADGKRYAYVPDTEDDAEPWWYQVDCGTDWTYDEWLVEHRPEALPLREFTAPEEGA